jgi:hypothetical protein
MTKARKQTKAKDSGDYRSMEETNKIFEQVIKAAVTTPKSKVMEAIKKDKASRQKKSPKKS